MDYRTIVEKHPDRYVIAAVGTIVKPKYLNNEELYQLISDVEATLIYLMSDSLIHNNKCTLSCNPSIILLRSG